MPKRKDLFGAEVLIAGEVIEHLWMGKQEWITVRLTNNHVITISVKQCKEIVPKDGSQ